MARRGDVRSSSCKSACECSGDGAAEGGGWAVLISRSPMAVVATMRVQSAMASASVSKRRADCMTCCAATADCGFELSGFEGCGEVVDEAEVGEAEVLHGAGGCADVAGVARADEDDGEAGAGCGGEHKTECRPITREGNARRWLDGSSGFAVRRVLVERDRGEVFGIFLWVVVQIHEVISVVDLQDQAVEDGRAEKPG